jgi:hypothetical protein
LLFGSRIIFTTCESAITILSRLDFQPELFEEISYGFEEDAVKKYLPVLTENEFVCPPVKQFFDLG